MKATRADLMTALRRSVPCALFGLVLVAVGKWVVPDWLAAEREREFQAMERSHAEWVKKRSALPSSLASAAGAQSAQSASAPASSGARPPKPALMTPPADDTTTTPAYDPYKRRSFLEILGTAFSKAFDILKPVLGTLVAWLGWFFVAWGVLAFLVNLLSPDRDPPKGSDAPDAPGAAP